LKRKQSQYWLVSHDNNQRPIGLVKVIGEKATVIAGDGIALQGFKGGSPDTLTKPAWQFQLLTCSACHPVLGKWIDKLGPVVDSAAKLKKQLERRRIRQRGQTLSAEAVANIMTLLANGVSQRDVAARHKVSRAFVQRLSSSEPPTL
jgi:hypothetical protein